MPAAGARSESTQKAVPGRSSTFGSTVVVPYANTVYESPATVYTGIVSGLWASANGYARVTSLAEQL